jgi:RHS repeat-associated protein
MNEAGHVMMKLLALKAFAAIALATWLSLGNVTTAQAANGQCRWEGGPGASGETNKYCLAEDCSGNGGFARCSKAEGAAQSPSLESLLGPEKWVYSACNHGPPQMSNYAGWCKAAGGVWDGSNARCNGLAPGIFSGGTSSNSDGTTSSIAQAWAEDKFPEHCSVSVASDTGWGASVASGFCWTGSSSSSRGILVSSYRQKVYQASGGSGCSSSFTVSFAMERGTQCPSGYKSRAGAMAGAECYVPAPECCTRGNPTSPITGAKTQQETDYRGPSGLEFVRNYDSTGFYRPTQLTTNAPINTEMDGSDFWVHSYDRRLYLVTGNSELLAIARRQNGSVKLFDTLGREQANVNGAAARLNEVPGIGWNLTLENLDVEHYDSAGRLLSITSRAGQVTSLTYTGDKLTTVTGHFGHTLQFSYDADGLLATLTLPGNEVIEYQYDEWKRLIKVIYPGRAPRTYAYGNAKHGWLLTAIADDGVNFATYTYDASGRVINSEHAGGTDRYQFVYGTASTTVTDPSGAVSQHGLQAASGVLRLNSVSTPCRDCGSIAFTSYDTNGNKSATTDFNGVQTLYLYDPVRNLETWRTEAAGTPVERVVTTTWHPTFRSPEQINEPGRRTDFTYDPQGNLLTRTLTDTATNVSQTVTYTYNSLGQVLAEDGPRTDVNDITTYAYHSCATGNECGRLATITNAAGHTTSHLTYNAHGSPLTSSDPNGLITTLAYDSANRLQSRTVGTETTTIDYWPNGLQRKITSPDGSFVEYSYDAARRLVGIEDHEGNRIVYTLDTAGNRIREDVYDSSDVLVRTRSAVFDSLGRKLQDIDSGSHVSAYEFDSIGNLLSTTDPLNRVTLNFYDELGRLSSTVDPIGQVTGFAYDANGNLVAVTDPRQLVTGYTYDGFGKLVQLSSPDTGISTSEFDEDGELLETTDSRGKTVEFSHDALGRVLATEYGEQAATYTYDTGPNALGRISNLSNATTSISWSYDAYGRISGKSQVVGAVSLSSTYTYDASGRLASMTTPSGQLFEYQYLNGRLSGIKVNGAQLLNNILFAPFGPTRGWQWGNGTYTVREYDLDGRISMIDSAGLASYAYDPAGAIQSITDESVAPSSAAQPSVELAVSESSNRLTTVTDGVARSYAYDAAGNTLSDGIRGFTYDDSGRMATATRDGITTQYAYNALGQRVRKSSAGVLQYFVYDESGHLLGTYGPNGSLIEEFVWLGDIPVATVRHTDSGGIGFFYIHTDHLNTPTRVTRHDDNAVMWRWDRDPFGNGVPNEDAEGNGQFVFLNLRFPGQQFDSETGLHYNYFRDYDPAVGRYAQSDPIGLEGGLNTYRYADANPLMLVDPEGLTPATGTSAPGIRIPGIRIPAPNPIASAGIYGFGFGTVMYPYIAQPLGDAIDRLCKPDCNPPKGTVCFIIDRVPPSKPHWPIPGSHYHLWQMNQSPEGMCFWNKLGASRTAPPGAVPCPFTRPKR